MTRTEFVQRGRRLEWLTLLWNLAEGGIAVAAALAAGSVVVLGFGIDSFVECASSLVLLWRLYAERKAVEPERIEQLDRRAHRLVGASLFALAAFIALDGGRALWLRERPDVTIAGLVLSAVSLPVMLWLARAKRHVAAAIESRALRADAFQTTACMWLSIITLIGAGANAGFGWWWADPVAAIAMTYFLVSEGLEAWRGEDSCNGDCHG
jgi:divalent metal cation (Fe/Co/Zn/Cd) transporter